MKRPHIPSPVRYHGNHRLRLGLKKQHPHIVFLPHHWSLINSLMWIHLEMSVPCELGGKRWNREINDHISSRLFLQADEVYNTSVKYYTSTTSHELFTSTVKYPWRSVLSSACFPASMQWFEYFHRDGGRLDVCRVVLRGLPVWWYNGVSFNAGIRRR